MSAPATAWTWTGDCRLEEIRAAASAARAFLAGHGLPDTDLAAWELMLTEAGNNAVLHAGPEGLRLPVALRVALSGDRVIARVHDHTPGFVWPDNPALPADDAESGRGLFLLATLSSFRSYSRSPEGNVLTLERPITRDAEPEVVRLAHRLAESERTLQRMTEELFACYESLTAIFTLSAASRQTSSLAEFGAQLLQRLTTVTGSDCAVLRMADPDGAELLTVAAVGALDTSPLIRAEESAATVGSGPLGSGRADVDARHGSTDAATDPVVAPSSRLVDPSPSEQAVIRATTRPSTIAGPTHPAPPAERRTAAGRGRTVQGPTASGPTAPDPTAAVSTRDPDGRWRGHAATGDGRAGRSGRSVA